MIDCSFDELDLASTYGDSTFTAVSYTWGSEKDSKHIILNGTIVVVRKNLYNFLVHALQEGWNSHLWIDALCIYQTDTTEKNNQIARMGEIYSVLAKS